jgi:hypothetical protein
MTDHDLDVDDDALAAMPHGELVALLNQLYTRMGEAPISASTARASSDDELRVSIQTVMRRVAARLGRSPTPKQPHGRTRTAEAGSARRRADKNEGRFERVFVVLVATDGALVALARDTCRARGVVLVSVASSEILATLVANVKPTHVVLDGAADALDAALREELEARGIGVRWCQGPGPTIEALAEIG